MKCPLCGNTSCSTVFELENVPTNQHRLFANEEEAISIERGDLDYKICSHCMFVFNTAFDPGKVLYHSDYDNSQTHSSTFNKYIDDLICSLNSRLNLENKTVLDIGCGQGQFLTELIKKTGCEGIGFDPAFIGEDPCIKKEFFTEDTIVDADIIVSRHTIEHLSDPFKTLIAPLCRRSPEAILLETPSIKWIIENEVVWDLFYEHCSLFCDASISNIFASSGYYPKVNNVFGDQYLWVEASLSSKKFRQVVDKKFFSKAVDFPTIYRKKINHIKEVIKKAGKVCLWGCGAKGVTLSNALDRDAIDCVVDINPRKVGKFVPGTGHPIVSPQQAIDRGVRSTVLMNPNYKDEALKILDGSDVEVIEI